MHTVFICPVLVWLCPGNMSEYPYPLVHETTSQLPCEGSVAIFPLSREIDMRQRELINPKFSQGKSHLPL